MGCFIKDIFEKKESKEAHSQFVRFGKGDYKGRAALSIVISNDKIKIGGSFEYANDFVKLSADLGSLNFSGIILSKEKLEGFTGKEKKGISEYQFAGDSKKIKEIQEKAYFMLLDGENSEILLKMKKKLPKPGKSGELKIDDKFCILEANIKYLSKIKDYFFWDVNIKKKAKIMHTFEIKEIILPKGEKDFEKIRILAKRKGNLIRKIACDGNEEAKEIGFEV